MEKENKTRPQKTTPSEMELAICAGIMMFQAVGKGRNPFVNQTLSLLRKEEINTAQKQGRK